MFVFKKPELAVYQLAETTFKFRQSSERKESDLENFIRFENDYKNNNNLLADYATNKEDYYAAWLLKDFFNVHDENSKPCNIRDFDLEAKVGLIRALKKTDSEFSKWFASHCEPAEKKTKEDVPVGEVVGSESVPGVPVEQ
ncbi:MAG: hypothetical protein LBU89_07625 [Fibromonadaceae bacterium]|jgi:hypothetical protein|nr:hypothetical protein [Fibromonadaceae bacterium]